MNEVPQHAPMSLILSLIVVKTALVSMIMFLLNRYSQTTASARVLLNTAILGAYGIWLISMLLLWH